MAMNWLQSKWYDFRHWFFQCKIDEEGDLVLLVANIVGICKYKEHAIVRWFPDPMQDAGRWTQGGDRVTIIVRITSYA